MESRTIALIRANARRISDTRGQLQRHPEEDITDYVNEANRAYRSMVTSLGYRFYLTSTAPDTLSNKTVANEQFLEIDWPADAAKIRGIDVQPANAPNLWAPLREIVFGQRREYLYYPPVVPTGNFKIWYLTDPTTFVHTTDDSKVIVTPPEGLAWIEAYVGLQLCTEDDDPEGTSALLRQKMLEIRERTAADVPKTSSGAAYRVRGRNQPRPWWDEPGYYHVRSTPDQGGTSPSTGKIQLFLPYGV